MVADSARQVGEPGPLHNERCLSFAEVVESVKSGRPEVDIGLALNTLHLVYRIKELYDEKGQITKEVNLRVADETIQLSHSGCITGEGYVNNADRIQVINCPSDTSLRCAGCILNKTFGESVVKRLTERTASMRVKSQSV